MAYLHCVIENNLCKVVRYFKNGNGPLGPTSDFSTGNVFAPVRHQEGECYIFDTSLGTTLISDTTDNNTLDVADSSTLIDGVKIGIRLTNGVHHWDEVDENISVTQVTLKHGLPFQALSGSQVLTISDLEGDTSGSLDRNFKLIKSNKVSDHSDLLIEKGVLYNDHYFKLDEKGIHYCGDASGFIAIGADLSGMPFPTVGGYMYIAADNNDAIGLVLTALPRLKEIYGDVSGQKYLETLIDQAQNTQAAMAAILDNRT